MRSSLQSTASDPIGSERPRTLGFFILPAKRERAKGEMRRKITDLRERLSAALRDQFAREIARSLERICEGIAPYSRFVRAERDKLREMEQELIRSPPRSTDCGRGSTVTQPDRRLDSLHEVRRAVGLRG